MADLESFFAKKDRKKKNKKAEILPEDLLKKIELAQKEESVEADTQGLVDNGYDSNGDQPQKVSTSVTNSSKQTHEDDEWDEFEGEKEVDISNLKIQNLGEMEKERQEVEDQEELQKAVEESKSTMKWNIARKEESSDDEQPDEKTDEVGTRSNDQDKSSAADNNNKEEAKTEAPAASQAKRYIPPALRNQGLGMSQDIRSMPASGGPMLEKTSLKRNPMKNQKIDVNSTDQFPSLGMAVQSSGGRSLGPDSSFTSVRKGARSGQESTADQQGLSTSNKFAVLKSNRT
ncbi:protein CDV3 homolog [Galendromus occidentalis]|uniref:Protein CDV3 homolog n=1 Tax=Galendromus occidentalis TaxID=34638 RepID=A0AAJ6VYF9_9ACAR|nr:protein CDV3 homolog [Galendromus occidentalis]